jgi:hypothetical protein
VNEESVNERTTQPPSHLNKALSDFGAPLSVIAPYTSTRPFLHGLSGIDELRVQNRRVHEPGYAK